MNRRTAALALLALAAASPAIAQQAARDAAEQLDRIGAYDNGLNSVIASNPNAPAEAAAAEKARLQRGHWDCWR